MQVTYRSLRYPQDWPVSAAREKGVDVHVALTLVRAAQEQDVDVVVVASHDTDLEPALEMAVSDAQAKVETAGWQGANVLRPKGRRLWHTALSAADMVKTRDRTNYAPPQM